MIKDILKLIPVMQSTSVLKSNIDFSEKKNKSTDFVKQGFKNILGVSLIDLTANEINILD